VNGNVVASMTHEDVLGVITKTTKVEMVVRRVETDISSPRKSSGGNEVFPQVLSRQDSVGRKSSRSGGQYIITVKVTKSADKGLGFSTAVANGTLVVTSVAPDGPASDALKPSDTILSINGSPVAGGTDSEVERVQIQLLSAIRANDIVSLMVRR